MLSFNYISELIHGLIKEDDVKVLPLIYVRKIILSRNNMLDSGNIISFDWFPLPEKNKSKKYKEEIQFRESVFLFIKEEFRNSGLLIDNDLIEKVLAYEHLILPYIGNIKTYYKILEDIKNHKKISFLFEYKFDKWTNWKKSINKAVDCFIIDFGVYPNILIANKHTLSQINLLINNIPGAKKEIFRFDTKSLKNINVDEEEEVELSGFESENFYLIFSKDEKINDKTFLLYYKDHPDLDDDDDDDRFDSKSPVNPIPVGKESRSK